MDIATINQKYIDLENDEYQVEGLLKKRIEPSAYCNLFLAVEKPSNKRFFLLEVKTQSISSDINLPQSKGFEVITLIIKPGINGKVYLILKLTELSFREVFSVLVQDLIDYISKQTNENEGINSFISRLNRWKAFFQNFSVNGLSEPEQLGLFTELWFLYNFLLNNVGISKAILGWTGPNGTNQDFQLGSCAVEVKSSIGSPHEKIMVSNVRQLDLTGLSSLILYYAAFDSRQNGILSLPKLIEQMRTLIMSKDDNFLINFNEKLRDSGYLDIHENLYLKNKYTLRHQYFFQVGDGFPRILENDLLKGVGDVKYSIMISSCMQYQIGEMTALNIIKGMAEND